MSKVVYTGKTHTTGGRDGASRSLDGRLDIKLSPPGSTGAGTNPGAASLRRVGPHVSSARSERPPANATSACLPMPQLIPRSTLPWVMMAICYARG